MSQSGLRLQDRALAFASVLEIGTGFITMLDPAVVARLLLGADLAGAGVMVGRCFGIALFAQGLACWPSRAAHTGSRLPAFRSMLSYNILISLYLAYLGTLGPAEGWLLWPAVALHGVIAGLLALTWRVPQSIDE